MGLKRGPVPACKAYANATQTIPNATVTVVALAAEVFDTTNMHDTVTNNSRIVISRPGKYAVSAVASPGANTGVAQIRILKNGAASAISQTVPNGGNGTGPTVSDLVNCVAGDYLEMAIYQNSGASSTCGAGVETTFLTAVWMCA